MTELDKVWKDCLQMWKWIAKVWDGTVNVNILKRQWLEKYGFKTKNIFANCFFCAYVKDKHADCGMCPGVEIDPSFDCASDDYHYSQDPVGFYAEISRLNTIRMERE